MVFRATAPVLDDPFFDSFTPYLPLTLDQPLGLSNATDDLATVQAQVQAKRAAYERYVQQFGEMSEVYAGMAAALAWNTLYDPKLDRVFSTVDRSWNVSRGGYVFFGWDNFFQALMIGLDAPDLAMANAIEALNEVTEEGFVSNQSQANGRKSWDRSQPPVGGVTCWKIYQRHPKRWFLAEIYPKLRRWNDWWLERRLQGELLAWGSHRDKNPFHDTRYNNLEAAMLETGIDDSPMYEGVDFDPEKGMMELHDVGLNALYIGDCLALAKMAEALGKKQEAKTLRKRAQRLQKALQALWHEENGLFQNYDLAKQAFSDRLSPTSFYPLIGHTATQAQAQAMIERHLLNEAEFWGEWVLPSIAKNDPLFPKQRYWRGAIWAPMNFLVYLGLREYEGFDDVRSDLVEKSVAIFRRNWVEQGFVCENYSPLDGSCTEARLKSSPWYTWGGLMAIMGLMEAGHYQPGQ